MNRQTIRVKTKRSFGTISFLVIVIVFYMTITAQILIPILKRAKESVKLQEKAQVIEKAKDHSVLIPPRLGKKSYIHYVKTATAFMESLEND